VFSASPSVSALETMIEILNRHRPPVLLASVVVAQVLLLAFQIKREHDVRLIRYWTVELVTPVERAGTWTLGKIRGVWGGYLALRDARKENERLRNEAEILRLRNRDLESRAAEAQRLRILLDFREVHSEARMMAAQVIGASADPASHTIFINRGERDHLRTDLPVITPDGIVGKTLRVYRTTSQVLLITDKDSGVGALFAGSRTHGIVNGTGDPQPRLDYVVNDEKVEPGEAVLTSGEDRVYPKDLPIGNVTDVTAGSPFQVIHLRPAVRLDRLEDVLVLLSPQELTLNRAEETSNASKEPGTQPSSDASTQSSVASRQSTQAPRATGASNTAKPPAADSNSANTTPKPVIHKPQPPAQTPQPAPPVPQQ